MAPPEHLPTWLLRPLPANAVTDTALHARIDEMCGRLPESLKELHAALDAVKAYREYDAAANRASAHVWGALARFEPPAPAAVRAHLLDLAAAHFVEEASARICRRLVKDPAVMVRTRARRLIKRVGFREVALPLKPSAAWDATGWLQGLERGRLARHPQGRRALEKRGLPVVTTIAELRQLLGIKSARQLGFFLLATDANDGPYTSFTIPKRDGSERAICAPKKQLRWVQRQVLDKMLAKVEVHASAHGFIPGRSTVTNAAQHRGAKLLLKFDLTDFFPTVHYYRVLGLFAGLGYFVGNGKFSSADEGVAIAPTLARLCCYAAEARAWGGALLPQGAPTSPAISNLVRRRLDARLLGLAKRNKGTYTRYADDLTFSFKEKGVGLGRFRWWVDQICHQEGFFVNQKKFRVIRSSQRQLVTGIVVNDEFRVPRELRRSFRAILHNCRKNGIEAEARGRAGFDAYLRGLASYIHMVHPEEGERLLSEVDALLGPETEEGT